jgi:hypothetical protein
MKTTAATAFVASSSRKLDLMKILTVPSKVASALDWRKLGTSSVLTLAVHSDRIEAVTAHHPSDDGEKSRNNNVIFESLQLSKNGRDIPEFTKQRLKDIIKEQNVCGIVVSFPIQPDTGKLGYAAGRTLWMMERLLMQDQSSGSNNNNTTSPTLPLNRPICLWDSVHAEQPPIDAWGRSPVYANTSTKLCHSASQEQYHQDEGITAARVWEDFMRTNWPDIYRYHPAPLQKYSHSQQQQPQQQQGYNAIRSTSRNEDWDDLHEHDGSAKHGMAA